MLPPLTDALPQIAAFLSALVAAYTAYRTATRHATRAEVALLREEVARLHERVKSLTEENVTLQTENGSLRADVAELRATLFDHERMRGELAHLAAENAVLRGSRHQVAGDAMAGSEGPSPTMVVRAPRKARPKARG